MSSGRSRRKNEFSHEDRAAATQLFGSMGNQAECGMWLAVGGRKTDATFKTIMMTGKAKSCQNGRQNASRTTRRRMVKRLTFAKTGEAVLDFQFELGRGLKLETNFDLGGNPNVVTQVRKVDVGPGVVGHF